MNFDDPAKINRPKNPSFEEKLETFFLNNFDKENDPEKRFANVIKNLRVYETESQGAVTGEEIDKMEKDLRIACNELDKNIFLNKCVESVQSLINWRNQNPRQFEEMQRKRFVENSGFIPVNEVVSYGIWARDDKTRSAHIHVAPGETFGNKEKLLLLQDGLKKLAEIFRQDETLKVLTATSWLVVARRNILERFGFTVTGEISAKEKAEIFPDEIRPVAKAYMTRETLIEKY